MDLFSMGVFDDEDRPKQHKPAPVRCLEDELLPSLPKIANPCERCTLSSALTGRTLCLVCYRAQATDARNKRRFQEHRAESRVLERADKVGWIVPAHYDTHTIGRLIGKGTLRWMSSTERRRYGLQKFDFVAVRVQP